MPQTASSNHAAFADVQEIIADIRDGRMVIIVDDEDRENEGDLLMAAARVRPEDINYMARYGRGLICLTLTRNRCLQLRLPLMVTGTDESHATNFTVSIEAAEGVTTGISAHDRARTIRVAVAPEAHPEDLRQPGHVFPLMAQPGGVLTRAGHTEAGCDLARLAGLEPAAVIVEILDEDGGMARRPQLMRFAREHGLRIGTVADLIHHRMQHEQTVEPVAECALPTIHGDFRLKAYHDAADDQLHLALIRGVIRPEEPVLVRVHMEDRLCDMLGTTFHETSWSLREALERVAREPAGGVVVLLRGGEDAQGLLRRIMDHQLHDKGIELPKPPISSELRTFGIGAQILADLGVRRMRVMGSPKRLLGLSGFGLEIVEYVAGNG